jgi:hypothetical protein
MPTLQRKESRPSVAEKRTGTTLNLLENFGEKAKANQTLRDRSGENPALQWQRSNMENL